jgi:hypothetical protein
VRTRSLAATLTLAAGLGLAGVATAPAASANGPCNYFTTDAAQVRENPTINSIVRKTVQVNYHVTGPAPCGAQVGWDGRLWVPVDCGCTTNGGWIIADKLHYVGV